MKNQKVREIVIEIERVQFIRKKTRTHLTFCNNCQKEGDFISLREAASLFSTDMANLFQFIKTNNSHYQPNTGGEIYICLISLLACIREKTSPFRMKMIEEH